MIKTLVRAGLVLLALSTSASAEPMKVTLLGTGVPTPRPTSFSASTLVEAGNEKLLFDLGRGSTMQLYKLKIPLGAITANFITHLHSDHLVGLPDMWLTGWLATPWASPQRTDEALRAQGHRRDDGEPDEGIRRRHPHSHR
ncbi:MBL fold metallo-hydrolase [Bradyrhizobium sp. BR 1432]|uniref:MBL fold metallo-hydrolase n=1 Tax=Bradyrhizobium sp. BR 1432 TaxID=3447966 RepID=UPI003EE56BAF